MILFSYCVIVNDSKSEPSFGNFYESGSKDKFLEFLDTQGYDFKEISNSISVHSPIDKGDKCFVYFFNDYGIIGKQYEKS